jgi:ABC-type lipoprotein release transport system permease subunit
MIGRRFLLTRLAARNVARNARRSVLTALAMVIGLALLVFSRAIADGAHEDWIRSGVRLGDGHVVIEAPDFARSGDLADRLGADALRVVSEAVSDSDLTPKIVAVAPRITVAGLASSAGAAVPVRVIGVDPAAEARFSLLSEKGVEGRTLQKGDRNAAFIGERLAHRLGLHVGSRLVLTAQDGSGQIADQLFRVAGLFRTGLPEADQGLVQVPITTMGAWLGVPQSATEVAVLLKSNAMVEEVVSALRHELIPWASDIRVLDWRHAMPELDAAVRLDDYGDYLMHAILLAIAALAIVNTMLMSILHRSREFAILRALGLTRLQTGRVVFTEGLVLTFVSGIVGIALGVSVTWVFFRHGLDYSAFMKGDVTMSGTVISPVIMPQLGLRQIAQSLAFIVAVGVLSAVYPAWRAMRIDLIAAMKFAE